MSGFIVSPGLDLDSIFQLKPPAITDASGILIGQLILDGIETDPLGLLVVPATGFKIKKTVPIVTIVDLADHYKKKGINTYAVNTGFRINNIDLTNVFEWGGYIPSIITPTLTVTGRTASINVTGNYYAVDISSNRIYNGVVGGNSGQVSHNPYTFRCLTEFGENVIFYVFIYNGFFGNMRFSTYNTTTLGRPVFNSINLLTATDTNLTFSITGQNYSKITYYMAVGGAVDTIVSSSTTIISIPIVTTVTSFFIEFIAINQFDEIGQRRTRTITYNQETVDHVDVTTTYTQDTPSYTYRGDFFVVAAGGSGGSGGASRRNIGGNGGGGGSAGYDEITGIVFDGTIAVRSVSYTCGEGGAGVGGVGSGPNTLIPGAGNNGNNGNTGGSSSIVVTGVITVSATGGSGGGAGASGGSSGGGGAGGIPNGIAGIGMTAGSLLFSGFGNGSQGGGGAGSGGSGSTLAGENGFTRATFYHVVMT